MSLDVFSIHDPHKPLSVEAVIEIARLLEELKGHHAWPVFVAVARRRKMEMLLAEIGVEQSTLRLKGIDDAVEMVLSEPERMREHAADAYRAIAMQNQAQQAHEAAGAQELSI